jgi:hypothetical protein
MLKGKSAAVCKMDRAMQGAGGVNEQEDAISNAMRFCCLDCGVDTAEIDEYYIVTPEVWARAMATGGDEGMLCIGCLEKRLGYQLDPADFANLWMHWVEPVSERLRARLGHGVDLEVAKGMLAAQEAAQKSKARWFMAQPSFAEMMERLAEQP